MNTALVLVDIQTDFSPGEMMGSKAALNAAEIVSQLRPRWGIR